MIFVISGTEKFPFDRLVREIDRLSGNNIITDQVFVQLGSCQYQPVYCQWERLIPFEDMCKRIETADLIIAHAGAGTTLLCLRYNKKTILVPRRKKYKEHVDDHQVTFAEKMLETGRVNIAFRIKDIAELIHIGKNGSIKHSMKKSDQPDLAQYLCRIL